MESLLASLVAANSVNPELAPGAPGEGAVAALVEAYFDDPRFELHRLERTPGRPSIVVRLAGTGGGPGLMFNAHMDTVGVEGMADPFEPRREDGRLYGRGAYDMKGSLAAAMTALRRLPRLPGDVYLAAVADEEHGSLGTAEVLEQFRPHACLVTEPTALTLGVAHKGFAWLEVETAGRAAHGSRFDLGADANLAMAPVLAHLAVLERELRARPPHPLLGPPSLHLARLEGGTGWSTYAARCVAYIERRLLPGESGAQAAAEIGFGARVVMERPAFATAPGSPLLQAARAALPEAPLTGQTPWFDAALYAAAGVDTILLGPAGGGAHEAIEWVELSSVAAAAAVYENIARRFCQIGVL